ncbi:hypothetical protein GCM10022215_08480 [Nocardioides fonticola]|uniref:Uncharacterized protein n=1 Tax=Nocardioides fonticola TaxID=450363 RepID=A0ABP7XDW6_9ACTN
MTARTLVVGLVGEATAEQLDVLRQLGDRLGVEVAVIDGCSALALFEGVDAVSQGRETFGERIEVLKDSLQRSNDDLRVLHGELGRLALLLEQRQELLDVTRTDLRHGDLLSSVVGTSEGTSVAGPEGPATPFGPSPHPSRPVPASLAQWLDQLLPDGEAIERRMRELEERLERLLERRSKAISDAIAANADRRLGRRQ